VVPAYNGFDLTHACLSSIAEIGAGLSFEVIVVDDGSSDNTCDLKRLVEGATIIRSQENHGFVSACNTGSETARGEFLVFLNNDTRVTSGWLDSLVEPLVSDATVGLVGAKLIYPDGRLQEAGGIVFRDGSAWNYGRWDDPRDGRYDFMRAVDYCSGASLAIRRDLYFQLGRFDDRFSPGFYEDCDLAFRVRSSGRRVVFQPRSVVVHLEGATTGRDTGTGLRRYQTIHRSTFASLWAEALEHQPPAGENPDLARDWNTRRRVLVIDAYTPTPDRDAGSLRMFSVLRLLRDLGCSVTFIPLNLAHFGRYTEALQAMGVEALFHPYVPTIRHHLIGNGRRYDTVILSRLEVVSETLDLVQSYCRNARVVFDTVDLGSLSESRRVMITAGSQTRAERYRRQELAAIAACDVSLVVSPVEKEVLGRAAPGASIEILSLIDTPNPTDIPFEERSGIVYIASFAHPPNRDALEFYLRKIRPCLVGSVGEAVLTVVGADPPSRLRRLAGDRVRFVGQVEDIREIFAMTRLSLAPLRYGAGVKGKVITSLRFGVPVVTTTIGAEGIDLENRKNAMVADEPQAFADAMAAIYENPELWSTLASAGPEVVATMFSARRARTTLARLLRLTDQTEGSD